MSKLDSNYNGYARVNEFQHYHFLDLSVDERKLLNKYDEFYTNNYTDILIFDIRINELYQSDWVYSTESLARNLNLSCEILRTGCWNFIFFELVYYKVIVKGDKESLEKFHRNICNQGNTLCQNYTKATIQLRW